MYKKLLGGMIAFAFLSVMLAACTIRDASVSTGTPVHMGAANFIQSTIAIKKGDSINLIDDSSSPHIVVNGKWNGSQQLPAKEAGAPTVNLKFNGSDSAAAGPFNTAGKFDLYCTIHGGMNLVVTVQ
jgi:plastocyanin